MVENMHVLLKRQLKKHILPDGVLQAQDPLFSAINEMYQHNDAERKLLERSLELSSQELMQRNSEIQAIFNALPDMFLRLDKQGTIVSFKAGARDFYVPAAALRGARIQDVHEQGIAEKFQNAMEEIFRSRATVTLEYALVRNGKAAFYEARLQPLLADQIVVVIREMTIYKKALADLKESEDRYAVAAAGANDGLWDWDLRRETIYYSARWKQMLGYADDEITAAPEEWLRRIHAEDVLFFNRTLELFKQKNSNTHMNIEYRMLHKNGTYVWMLARGIAVYDEQGQLARLAGSQTDITKNKVAEEQLRYDALHDKLTGLPNRTLFIDRLLNLIERAKRHRNIRFAVL
ncbi:MAG: PAS domain-containing protein, partial [Candidatus Omnitrophica bacterium]|nr:PAS domain-containing protein [Candidatus Omnitrophota bacterium]